MLKNLILDMGNVMLRFSPDLFIRRLGIVDPEIHNRLRREVFQSLEWIAVHNEMHNKYRNIHKQKHYRSNSCRKRKLSEHGTFQNQTNDNC